MQLRGFKFKPGPWNPVVLLAILFCLLMTVNPGTASAGEPATSLTIKVGYFGLPYTAVKVYSVSDLEAMPQVQQAYTFIDSMPAVVTDSAKGVKLTDLLADAGIDVSSIEVFYFYTTDIHKGWYETLPKSYLLDTERYYYPNLPTHWDSNTQSSLPGAEDEAIRVEPIIAIQDNWQRFVASPDFTKMTGDNAFRLVFGQTDTSTRNAFRSAKWIHEISVMLTGTPPTGVILDKNAVNLPVGGSVQLRATIVPDDATNKSVTWSSSNSEIATVDNNGMVSVVGPGTAGITVTTVVGDMTATCIVNGSVLVGSSQGAAPADTGSQKNGVQDAPAVPELPGADQQHYLAGKDAASKQSDIQSWHIFEMSADTAPLQIQMNQGLNSFQRLIFLFLFLTGAGRRFTEYTKEVAR